MRAYIAGPWFTPEQMSILEDVTTTVYKAGMTCFSPKDENLYIPGETSAYSVLIGNCEAIEISFKIAYLTPKPPYVDNPGVKNVNDVGNPAYTSTLRREY